MFIARENELNTLEELYSSAKFEFLVMYGRRRVGKTELLVQFAHKHQVLFFSAQEKNDELNLMEFSERIYDYFSEDYYAPFTSWDKAFGYIAAKTAERRVTVIIDEFPFIAGPNSAVKSALQHVIDHEMKNRNIFLILCGSSVSFMENEVMGHKSPLYGRRTYSMEVRPFDYYDSARFMGEYSTEDKLVTYGILGGIPCYLLQFDYTKSLRENIARQIVRQGAFLSDEPQFLLRQELREPAMYNSILEAIACGASGLNDIAAKIKVDSSKCNKYMETLKNIRLVDRIIPCTEKPTSRKSIYRISDNYYNFWYRFIFGGRNIHALMDEYAVADKIMSEISDYMGNIFEGICTEFMKRCIRRGDIDFTPTAIGRWWGSNPVKKCQDDIDILVINKKEKKAIFGECKYRNQAFDLREWEDLISASDIMSEISDRRYILFLKSSATKAVEDKLAACGGRIIGPEELLWEGSDEF